MLFVRAACCKDSLFVRLLFEMFQRAEETQLALVQVRFGSVSVRRNRLVQLLESDDKET